MTSNELLIESFNKGYRIVDGVIYNPDGKILKGYVDRGYRRFSPVRTMHVKVHRLVAYQKFGAALFEEGIEVRHLDNNKLNNSEDNIALGTHQQNMMDIPPEQRRINAGNQVRKYDYKAIREYYSQNRSYKDTMQKFNIESKGALHYILNKRKQGRVSESG